jgi:hypothetical protein
MIFAHSQSYLVLQAASQCPGAGPGPGRVGGGLGAKPDSERLKRSRWGRGTYASERDAGSRSSSRLCRCWPPRGSGAGARRSLR